RRGAAERDHGEIGERLLEPALAPERDAPPRGRDDDRGGDGHEDLEVVIGVEYQRRYRGDEQAADRAAGGDDQIILSEIPRTGAERRKLAVANHAADEKREREHRQDAVI